MRLPCRSGIGSHRVGRQVKNVCVTARGDHHRVRSIPLHFARHEVARYNAPRLSVDDHHVEHLVAVVHFDFALGDLPRHGRVRAEQQLLPRLSFGVESP